MSKFVQFVLPDAAVLINGDVITLDLTGMVAGPIATPTPTVVPTPTVAPTPTVPVVVSTPANPLDLVYFSESDIITDANRYSVVNAITINNNGNIRTIRAGIQPPIPYNVTATGSLIQVGQTTTTAPTPTAIPTPTVAPAPTPAPTSYPVHQQRTMNWPANGQDSDPSSNLQELQTVVWRIRIPTNVVPKPNNMGFARITERPGSAVIFHYMAVVVNGVIKVPMSDVKDTSPAINWTLGNPNGFRNMGALFNVQPGDIVDVYCKNDYNNTTQPSDVLFDFATPIRY